ncbi:hypothetical protein EMPS_10799 [Entomortierella parvispora]|uniref:Uncharacterized protein n=1 Tax=Entomortierella parvispora TaxID=205924 RepID=A0A9P3HKV2_9FUNG|nr:hypothetical protein EMPS_10799 [Entomortierella parvispora]
MPMRDLCCGNYYAEREVTTGPLKSVFRNIIPGNPHEEQLFQQQRVAFRQFSEKVASDHCASILGSTLDLIDTLREYASEIFLTKRSFDLFEPVIGPLAKSVMMDETFHFAVELTDEELEEEKKMDQEEEEEEERREKENPSSPLELEYKMRRKERMRLSKMQSNIRPRTWTEKNEPQLLYKFRLRRLEKAMALFPYVVKFAPDPVQQGLEEIGFMQQTQSLHEKVRSLLTCEGVSHVTVAQLKDDLGGYESDNYMDRNAAYKIKQDFFYEFSIRLSSEWHSRNPSHFYQGDIGGLLNDTLSEGGLVDKSSEERKHLKDQVVDGPLSFATPDIKFDWTAEAIVKMRKAVEKGHQKNPEIAAALFQE